MEEPRSPKSATVRRNPPRRPRTTPFKPTEMRNISLDTSYPPQPEAETEAETEAEACKSLKVFLRIRPPVLASPKKKKKKNGSQISNGKDELGNDCCLVMNDIHSVTVVPPACDASRLKSQIYAGFSHVFSSNSSQDEVYDKMVKPIVDDFLKGRSGLLAALGPSGSGKTHTVFGSSTHPGFIPRALRHIFNHSSSSSSSCSFYLSVFEIYNDKGKGEKLCDLSHSHPAHLYIHQSTVKGLKQVLIRDVAEAECVLAHATSKRATGFTNSNAQSSRSQCIINIHCDNHQNKGKSESPLSGPVLTFIDLAGAEREKKTRNQGGRLIESNFINNTSMVFSLCLRSLLEHQKNPKKPLQRHFQSSLLTRYLRDYLEGRKRMSLILTARSSPEDYFDTSFLLRQASPYMEIKFQNIEETSNLPYKRRRNQVASTEQQKRAKNEVEAASGDSGYYCKEDLTFGCKTDGTPGVSDKSLPDADNSDAKLQREYYVVQSFAKALWTVLKQYKERVKAMQRDIDVLTENVRAGDDHCSMLKKELDSLKSRCSCQKEVPVPTACSIGGTHSESSVCALEELAGFELVASANVQGRVNVEREVDPLPSAGEQCSFYPANEPLGVIASEEQLECSPIEQDGANLCQKKDELDHFGVEIAEAFKSEARSESSDMVTSLQKSQDSAKDFGFSVSQSTGNGSEEHQNCGPTNETEEQHRNSSPGTKVCAVVDEKIETVISSTKPSQVQYLPIQSVISHDDACKNASYEKMDVVDKDDKESLDITTCFPQHLVTDRKVQQDKLSNSKDKENVTDAPESNPFVLVTEKTPNRKPLKAERPKRRLMPASSLLLRDAGSMDITDESIKSLGGKGGQKLVAEQCRTTRGNASLLRLLKNQLPR